MTAQESISVSINNILLQHNKIKQLLIFTDMTTSIITSVIIAVTVLVSFAAFENNTLKNKLMFNAYMINHRKEWYRFFSNGIIHANIPHLTFNMYALWIFGSNVEKIYSLNWIYGAKGPLFYVLLYVGGLAMSSLYSYEKNKDNIYYNALGASGAVSAVMFSFIVLAPTAKLSLLILPIPGGIPAYIFGVLILGVEHYLSRRGNTGIAHDAHFWGSVFGVLFTIALKPGLAIDFIHKIQGTY
ncbi:MAG: rhomboid family intrarane serine protease [Bacteroidetes bacterium]|nr:rhomboid family intrarane serine protease [Bacteroidota bacterium]